MQESSFRFKHLPIKFKHFSFGGKIANKIFAKLAFFQKDRIVFWTFMILMDFNVEMKPFKFNICDNACSRWQHSKRLNKWIHGNNQSKKMEIFHHCKKLLNYWGKQKKWLQDTSARFKHLLIKPKQISFSGNISNENFAKPALFYKSYLDLFDLDGLEMKPFKFNICDNAGSSWGKPKLLENSKLPLVCCSDEWRGWVSINSPNSESCTSTSPFFH